MTEAQREPSKPGHKKPCCSESCWRFFPSGAGWLPRSVPPVCCCCCWISGQLCLFLWQLCLRLGELFSPSVTLPAAPPPPTPPPPPPPPPSPRRPSLYPTHWVIRILMSFIFFLEMIFHCVFFPLVAFPLLSSLSPPSTPSFSFSSFAHTSVTRSRSSPSPVYVLLSLSFCFPSSPLIIIPSLHADTDWLR